MEIVITQDFYPLIGGAHFWLYEVYKRWPKPIILLTRDYSQAPDLLAEQKAFDVQDHQSVKIKRCIHNIEEINITSSDFIRKTIRNLILLKKIANKHPVRLHVIRSFPEGILAVLFKKLLAKNCEIICYTHGEELLISKTSRQIAMLADWVYRNVDLIIANSRATSEIQTRLFPKRRLGDKSVIIHPGVDYAAYQIPEIKKESLRERWGWPSDTIILATCARMEPRKNHLQVVEAVAQLRNIGIPVAYVIASDGDLKKELIKKVKAHGLTEWVRFTGFLLKSERIEVMASSHLHVMPSVQVGPMIEGFGLVFMEAAAAGIPSIAGDVGGQPEAVLDKRTGFVVDGTKLDMLVEKIKILATNEDLRKKMGKEGKVWAQTNDWARVVERTYNQLGMK